MSEDAQRPKEADDGWVEEAVRTTPMFQPADMWVTSSGRNLSPLQFLAFTQEPRADLDGLSIEDFGLIEERCTRVDKRGVEVFTHFYTSGELLAYVTGDRQSPQRDMYIRYDRALAARGVLKTLEFVVKDEQGKVIDRILLHRRGSPAVEASRDDIMRSRNAFVNALLKTRSNKEVGYMRLLGDGVSLADKLIADGEARRRFQKNNPPPPMPATPIVDGEDREAKARENALQAALAANAWAGEAGPGSVMRPGEEGAAPDSEPDPEDSNGTDDAIVSGATMPAAPQDDADANPLGKELGGSMGFSDH